MKLAPEYDDASSFPGSTLCWVHLKCMRLFVVTSEIRITLQSILPP